MITTENEAELFLDEYKQNKTIVEATIRAFLNRSLQFEKVYEKPLYEFSIEEILEMYKSIHAISDGTLQNMNLTMKSFAKWLIHKKELDVVNKYENVSKELLLSCVDIKKREGMILTKEDLIEIQSGLVNWTDKGILQMLFLGAGANWLRELTFFSMSQVNKKEGKVYFRTGKIIPITEEDYTLIKNACSEESLVSFGTTCRVSSVKNYGFFKMRFNALSDSDNPEDESDQERRFRFIQRRLLLISKDVGIQLTSGCIQTGGLLHCLRQDVKKSGLTFREYIKTDDAKKLARRYDIYSELYSQILIDKFEKYFK